LTFWSLLVDLAPCRAADALCPPFRILACAGDGGAITAMLGTLRLVQSSLLGNRARNNGGALLSVRVLGLVASCLRQRTPLLCPLRVFVLLAWRQWWPLLL
jgi:hypothetical protein